MYVKEQYNLIGLYARCKLQVPHKDIFLWSRDAGTMFAMMFVDSFLYRNFSSEFFSIASTE